MKPIARYKDIVLNHRKAVCNILLGIVLLFILPIVIVVTSAVINKDIFYDYHLVCVEPIKNPDITRVVKTPPNREEGCIKLWKNPAEAESILTFATMGEYSEGREIKPGKSWEVKFNDVYNCSGNPKDIFWNNYSNCYCQRDQEKIIRMVSWNKIMIMSTLYYIILFVGCLIFLTGYLLVTFFYRHRFDIAKYFKKWESLLWNKDFLLKIALVLFIIFLILRIFNIHLTLPSFEPPSDPFSAGRV